MAVLSARRHSLGQNTKPSEHWHLRRILRCAPAFLLGCGLLFLLSQVTTARAREYSEYEIKAAFLYKFADFVEWPREKFPEAASPLIIGVLGKDPFGTILDDTVKDKQFQHRNILVKRSDEAGQLKNCQIVFVGEAEKSKTELNIAALNGWGILTIGESDDFLAKGGIIYFVLVESKVGFEIDSYNAKQAGLKLSSQLLKLAKKVWDATKK